jgi:tRNA threonylcarbamoyladenosine biosynthesis protein TsaE
MRETSKSENQTIALAQSLACQLRDAKTHKKPLCLHGDLGMGKSVFARAFIREMMGDETLEVPSPTFTLVQTYDAPSCQIYHFDLYRLKHPDEIFELGWEEALASGLVLVEWPERLGPYKPLGTLDIHIRTSDNDPQAREILITDPQG